MQLIVVEKFDCEETKTIVTEWSIEHGVEIIDFSEDSEEGNDQITVFAENGKKRIIEALQTVMWTELCDPDTQEGKNS